MKKFFLLSLLVMFSTSTLFISCSTEEDAQVSLSDQMIADQDFKDASEATMDFIITAISNNWLENLARINTIVDGRPVSELSDAELRGISNLLGMEIEEFLQHVEAFGVAVNDLYTKYPQLNDMGQDERNMVFSEALANSNAITDYVDVLQATARDGNGPPWLDGIFCTMQDYCYSSIDWLVPAALSLLDYACGFISGVDWNMPFLDYAEELVCVTLPGYVEAFLPGICEWIPCDD